MSPAKPAALLLVLLGALSPVLAQQYDLILRNGRILDGTGSPWVSGDIAIP